MSKSNRLGTFYFILIGQAMSFLGTSLTNFGLSVWVYEEAGSVLDFTMVAVAGVLPTVVFSPVAGALIDRWPRKKMLILGQLGSVLCTAIVAGMYWFEVLKVWHIIPIVVLSSAFMAFLRPGFMATITLLVDSEDLGKANGALATLYGVVMLIAPALAGTLIHLIGLKWVFVIDLATFSIGVGTLVVAKIPAVVSVNRGSGLSIMSEISDAWRYLKSKPALILLLTMTVVVNFNLAAIQVLVIPVVLGFANKAELGVVMSIGGAGVILGGLVMMAWGGPKRKIMGVIFSGLTIALLIVLFPMVTSVYIFGAGTFVAMAVYPIFTACTQSIWQLKVDADMQGRLFSFRSMVISAVAPIAFISSGFFADHFFEPFLMNQEKLTQVMTGRLVWVGELYGYGAGRGVAVMISLYGLICFICLLLGSISTRIRGIDSDLPDCNEDDVVAQKQQPAGSSL